MKWVAPLGAAAVLLVTAGAVIYHERSERERRATQRSCFVKLFFEQDATVEEMKATSRFVSAVEGVELVRFISRAAALEQMRSRYPDLFAELPYNPLPAALEVNARSAEGCRVVLAALSRRPPGVEKVRHRSPAPSTGN